jgi:hypothetical protein
MMAEFKLFVNMIASYFTKRVTPFTINRLSLALTQGVSIDAQTKLHFQSVSQMRHFCA